MLTLVVVPVVYCYMDDLAQWFKRQQGVRPATQPQPAATTAPDGPQ